MHLQLLNSLRRRSSWQSRVAFGPRNPRVASVSGYMTYCAAAAEQDGVLLSGLLQGPMDGGTLFRGRMECASSTGCLDASASVGMGILNQIL